ncbi:unnamed protein product [Bursaphelenchus okinawaensis]|uniref:RING-type E3 ubiquitin transferase n=1 Tax=Bursaphelenchus okinawaensis TaxID=465554 RepID=A0A811LQ87_9BILA|nr:unnamed protein product [Bursaphelenchus okinawaensis]CAG9127842.1 unnamed protein product [Bursaphelenchus okinawaensis]
MSNSIAGPAAQETITGVKLLVLNDYDRQRKPHPAIRDDTMIKIGSRTLSTEITCPICLDLFTTTMGTKECLHRFCSDCITTALLRNNRECPTCRKKIVSKRSLRPDINMDILINKLWPERKLFDDMQNAAQQHYQAESSVAALQKSIEIGIKAQAKNRRQRVIGSYDYDTKKKKKRNDGEEEVDSPEQLSPSAVDDDSPVDEGSSQPPSQEDEALSSSDSEDSDDSSSLSSTITDSSECEMEVDDQIPETSKSSMQAVEQGLEKMAELNIEQPKQEEINVMDSSGDTSALTEDPSTSEQVISDQIELEICPAKSLRRRLDIAPSVRKSRYIKTSLDCTIKHLCHYIRQAAQLELKPDADEDARVIPTVFYMYYLTSSLNIEQAESFTTLRQIHIYSTTTESHLKVVFDTQPNDDNQRDQNIAPEFDVDLDPDAGDEDPDWR